MKEAFIKLHISILIAGMTGVFGKLITLNEALLVWYRLLIASILFFSMLAYKKKLHAIDVHSFLKIAGTGCLLCLHWIFFYGSIKASNVSIGVVCFSLVGFFTALLEPILLKRRFFFRELMYSCLTLTGIILIFHFDTRYRLGIGLGVVSSMLAALFTITNKKVSANYPTSCVLFYEMISGFICISCILPIYFHLFDTSFKVPFATDFTYLFLLASICTIGMYLLQIEVLKKISAFTVNLSYNLEPVYSILIAMALFGEAKELNFAFYAGLGCIILSVILQTLNVTRQKKLQTLEE